MDCNITKCLIIDNEPAAIEIIKSHLKKLNFFEISGECNNAPDAINILKSENIDLIFLDINIPEVSGIEFLRSFPNHPYVIITTGYSKYAVEAFDLDVLDFLLKPILFERFMRAINRYFERTRMYKTTITNKTDENYNKDFIFIHEGKDQFKVYLNEILYLEGYGEYVRFFSKERKYLVRKPLLDFESELPAENFIRIHKSYIVNIQKVTGFSTAHVILKDAQLPIGRMFRNKVMNAIKEGT
jgi:DNA-binding LytR/AlgR family response regulator